MFENKIPEWKNSGTEPSEELKNNGFQGGYKPPAGIFNWFWNRVTKCIAEIQRAITSLTNQVDAHDLIQNGLIIDLEEHISDTKTNIHGVTAAQVGLDRVDNTPDSEKAVAFASESGVGRKVEHDLTIRFKGGSTESTDMFTFNGSASRSVNITPTKIGAAENDLSNVDDNVFAEKVKSTVAMGTPVIEATSTDGEIYTATYDKITELYNGLEITIIPNMTSTKAAVQFRLNNFGAKNVRAKINGYNNGNSGTIAALAGWIGENVPLTIRYVSKFDNWQTVDFSRPSASGLYGTLKPEQGGTGVTDLNDFYAVQAYHLAPNNCTDKDFNTLKRAGVYFGYTNMTNAAFPSEISVLEVIPYSDDWVLQRQTRLTDGKMFYRYLSSGNTWSSWEYIYTSNINDSAKLYTGTYAGNDGAMNSIDLPFTPKILIIEGEYAKATIISPQSAYNVITADGSTHDCQMYRGSVYWNGNKVTLSASDTKTAMNKNGITYTYVAFG